MFDVLAYKRKIAPNFLAIYAREKVGKTTALVSAIYEQLSEKNITDLKTKFNIDGITDTLLEKDSKMNVVDLDHGMEPFINRWVEKGKPIEETTDEKGLRHVRIPNVNVTTVNNKEEFQSAVWTFPKGYRFHVIDTFTRAGKHFIHSVNPANSPGVRKKNANMDIAFLFEDYIDRFEELAWGLNKEDAWLIVMCHERQFQQEIDGEREDCVEPLLYGSANGKLMRVTTGFWRLQLVDVRDPSTGQWVVGRNFRTAATTTIAAGDRTGALEPAEPANIAKAINKIQLARAAGIPTLPKETP